MTKKALATGFIIGALIVLGFIFTKQSGATGQHVETCICHNVQNNPHEVCSDDNSHVVGHLLHLRRGFDSFGQCPAPSPSPTSSPQPSSSPSASPSATPQPSEPPASPTPTPEATSSPVPSSTPGSGTPIPPPSFEVHEYGVGLCTVNPIGDVILQGFDWTGDELVFSWWPVDNAEHLALIYGYYGEDMVYGIPHIDRNATSVSIGFLDESRNVQAQLFAYNGNCSRESSVLDPAKGDKN